MMDQPIYLDYQASTPLDPKVREVMLPWMGDLFGNPHSSDHAHGWAAEEAVETARAQVAALIGAKPREIIFTSGATEANNLAIKGVARALKTDRNHLITCVTEHKCVLESCARLEGEGFRVTYLPVEANGLLNLDRLEAALDEKTALVSIMAVNNEIGVIQPLGEIAALCKKVGARLHTDAAQGVAKIPIDVQAMGIDLLSISGHKIYAPMGIGALYIRRKPAVPIEPLIDGGGQERGLRSGTVPAPLTIGFGESCRIAVAEMAEEATRLAALRDRFMARINTALDDVHLNGDAVERIPGNLNLSFADIDAQDLMMRLPRVSVSTGSACTTATVQASHVLQALGVEERLLHNAIRIGIGRFTTDEEVDIAADEIARAVNTLRQSAQVYEGVGGR
ncbi:MAG: IscS subfamily cysteine desulfurase [Rhodospirillaceae bacterium]|nr:IscS subfamily cysteine desulfurase [Rhodospirillaceae bacterium]HAA92881.1 IscS subfamily cysteine desulfurase [Rhodospirillaceae bacterium]